MAGSNNRTEAKHVLTKEEKKCLSKTRAEEGEVMKEAKKIISKHRIAIKELASR